MGLTPEHLAFLKCLGLACCPVWHFSFRLASCQGLYPRTSPIALAASGVTLHADLPLPNVHLRQCRQTALAEIPFELLGRAYAVLQDRLIDVYPAHPIGV